MVHRAPKEKCECGGSLRKLVARKKVNAVNCSHFRCRKCSKVKSVARKS